MTEPTKVLIVDDEPKICQFLEVLLQREGHTVSSVQRATDALSRIEQEDFDLVLTDLKMPGMDGFEFVSRMKALRPELPTIMITGYATVENAVKAMRYGVDDYVTKPFNIDELRKVVSRALKTAAVQDENRRLLDRLKETNAKLAEAKRRLAQRVQRTSGELRATRSSLKEHECQLAAHNLVGELITAEHDLDPLLNQVLAVINHRFGARYSSAMLVDRDDLVVRACEGERGEAYRGARRKLSDGVAGHVLLTGEASVVKDIQSSEVFRPSPDRAYRTPSFLSVPICHQGLVLGVINVGDKQDGAAFHETDLDMLVAIGNQIAPSVENAALCRALEERYADVIETLVTVLEAKDRYTSGHSQRVARYAAALGRANNLSEAEVEALDRSAQLHDIGKIAVHDFILKKAGRLTDDERRLFNTHASIGEHLVQTLDFLKHTRPLIRHHHERLDGEGYPDNLKGEAIPELVRYITIADSYDAMTSERPYRPPMSSQSAATEIRRCAGDQFDPNLVELFCQSVIPQQTEIAAG